MRVTASVACGAAGLTGATGWQRWGLAATDGVAIAPAASSPRWPKRPAQPAASTDTATDASRPRRARRRECRKSGLENMGKLDSEVGTDWIRQQLDASAVRGNVFVHDGQTNAAAPHHVAGLALATVKRLKNPLAISQGHTYTLVVNVDADQARQFTQLKADLAFQR